MNAENSKRLVDIQRKLRHLDEIIYREESYYPEHRNHSNLQKWYREWQLLASEYEAITGREWDIV